MLRYVDDILNKITMYRVVLYALCGMLVAAVGLSFVGLIPYSWFSILYSSAFITLVAWIGNDAFARIFRAPTNVESVFITALILVFLISPPHSPYDGAYYALATWATLWAIAGKFIFAIRRKHLFNPAALGVAMTGLFLGLGATWWVGTPWMLPFVLLLGLPLVRKIHRFDLFLSFMLSALVSITVTQVVAGVDLWSALVQEIVYSPLIFFATVMLTEPLTTPPTRWLRIIYGVFVGALFSPALNINGVYTTPELALLVGNIFSYLVSPKQKLMLRLAAIEKVANNTYDFVFETKQKMKFKPGQYLEWTLAHKKYDSRGVRRYFTIASSPTEQKLRIGVRFYQDASSFKKSLASLKPGQGIVASQLSGDFTMPRDKKRKLAFVAGGIGVTPFRSMIKYLIDSGEKRDVAMLYSARNEGDLAYRSLFDQARSLGMKVIYTLTDADVPQSWQGRRGPVDPKMIAEEIPDFAERTFYISGPRAMVTNFQDALAKMGVPRTHVKTDFFPGFA